MDKQLNKLIEVLTKEEITKIAEDTQFWVETPTEMMAFDWMPFARAIELAVREKFLSNNHVIYLD